MKIIIGNDHRGLKLKEQILKYLLSKNYDVENIYIDGLAPIITGIDISARFGLFLPFWAITVISANSSAKVGSKVGGTGGCFLPPSNPILLLMRISLYPP